MRELTSYERQFAVAESLDRLSERVVMRAVQVHAYLDDMHSMALAQRRDLYTLVVADVLGVDYCEVMAVERRTAKLVLYFAYAYLAPPGVRVTRIQDSLIMEPKVGTRWGQ